MQFYQENAKSYSESTFNTDFAKKIFEGMEDLVLMNGKNKTILDIGCGSGRDAAYLTSLGYTVEAYDQSKEMIKEAESLTKLDVFNVGSAQDFDSERQFDLAYSIACLLHLNDLEFEKAILNIFKQLHFGGFLYFTVKEGTGEETDHMGRYFNYFTKEKLETIFEKLGLQLLDISECQDLTRPEVNWLNVMVRKPM